MNLSVTQRIGGGFALLVVLLMSISATSYRSLSEVNRQIERTTEQITPIMIHSGDISIALLSANKAMMEFMSASEPDALEAQQAHFSRQSAHFNTQRKFLTQLGEHYPQVLESIQQLDSLSIQFFENSEKAFSNHLAYLELREKQAKLEQGLYSELQFFFADIEDLKKYGESDNEKNASDILTANLKTAEKDFNRTLLTNDLSEIKLLESAFKTPNYGLKGMEQRLNKLKSSGSNSAEDLLESLEILQSAVSNPEGPVQQHKKSVQLRLQSQQLLQSLSGTITDINETLHALRLNAQALAGKAKQQTSETVSFSQSLEIFISSLSVLIAVSIALWVTRSIRKPLSRVMAILKKISDGDLSQRIDIEHKDEFGRLSQWVNELADKQQKVIRDIQQASDEINTSAKEAAGISDRASQIMDDQRQHTTQVATAIHQMSASAAEVAKNAEQAQQQVSGIDNTAHSNRELMEKNITVVSSLASEIDRASGVISQLDEDSTDIGRILEVIEEIANQTNLLALNAAIEAARAGEQGRGFAVVADEVRTLAHRTQNSTQEIQAMIDKFQSGAKDAVAIMETSQREAKASVNQTEQAGESLQQMASQLSEVRNMSIHIATAAEQQTEVSMEISNSVQRIADMAEQGAQDAQQTARGSEALSGLAQRQQQLTKLFQLG